MNSCGLKLACLIDFQVYNIDFNIWTELQTAPRIQYMAACGLAEGRIFMIGGWEADTGEKNNR